MRSVVLGACASLAVLMAAEAAAAQATIDEPKTDASDATQEKLMCRRIAVTGSHLPRRVCLTSKQWHAYDSKNSDNTDRALDARAKSGFDKDRT